MDFEKLLSRDALTITPPPPAVISDAHGYRGSRGQGWIMKFSPVIIKGYWQVEKYPGVGKFF
jgi:hypothetical protein